MGRRKRSKRGKCHICGLTTDLTFEHVPPRAAFNDRPVVLTNFEKAMEWSPGQELRGPIQQKGAGAYTLCARCNNNTGSWYGPQFVEWTYRGLEILIDSRGTPSLFHLHYVFPLAVIKQIVTMFFSVNSEVFGDKHPDLVRFVLDREARRLPHWCRVFAYLNTSPRLRNQSVAARGSFTSSQFVTFSEIAFPPFGYVMTFDSGPPDDRLTEITHFGEYGYGEFDVIDLRIPHLPIATSLPGDYRTEEEVQKTVEETEREMAKRNAASNDRAT